MPESTFHSWVRSAGRQALITALPTARRGAASVPFIGLAEGVFLSGLRRAGLPMQRIRPAIELVHRRLGVEHALASKRLFTDGAEIMWEISDARDVDDDVRRDARSLIVLRNDQYVLRQVVDQFLRSITYDPVDGYAQRVRLPDYEVADLVADPHINFGHPVFAKRGAPLDAVLSRLRAGETVADVADDYGLGIDEVTEAAYRAHLRAA